ncbi:hypothetical protein HZC21_03065 [Candidatus Peregrinibacteria bacterium]|nr:hypothetical protein [Candidatus Peregrinibacteria bacterium]
MKHIPDTNPSDDPLESLMQAVSPHTNLTPEDIEELRDLDIDLTVEYLRISEAVDRIRADLSRVYSAIDENSAFRRPFNEQDSGTARFTDDEYFRVRPIGTFYAHLMTKDGRQRLQKHLTAFEESVVPALCRDIDCRFESGKVKSVQSVLDHLLEAETPADRLREIKKLKDAIRGRIIGGNMLAVEMAIENLHEVSAQRRYRVISLRSSYRDPEKAFEGRPHFACNITLAPEDRNLPPYELHIMTEKSARVSELTHPVAINGHVRGRVRLPNELEKYMVGLALGSAVTDCRDYLTRTI